ncbi:MAG: response regulator, partial [Candidatus Aureabacteria bacterium]|nr:response regulator [Candidatus Auribacterota bacterium]
MFRHCVAFIDDDEDLLFYLKHLLEGGRHKIEVHCYTSPKEAISSIQKIYPGVIFIDYQMMEENGLVILSKIKKLLPLSKIIMFTGEGNENVAVQAMKSGADDYLVKPVHDQVLMESLETYFKEFFSYLIRLNGKYDYPLSDPVIAHYEFLRSAYSGAMKSIKAVCYFFS